jgi:hypothetical protein
VGSSCEPSLVSAQSDRLVSVRDLSVHSSNIEISDTQLHACQDVVSRKGISFVAEERPSGTVGWQGGTIWLVSTDLDIEHWKPVAVRRL